MIVGTAGHIDHGKTSLVKALTGIDADRLKEEKERGITVDLGFAYQAQADGQVLGFVDVPGHEKLVRNMLAGATGMDHVMLVVAADDGPMPQTREHLAILDLLGLQRGVVAVSKCDLVDAPRLQQVQQEIAGLLRGTGLERAPVLPVSSVTGAGLDALRAHLDQARQAGTPQALEGHFRLSVDRSFTLAGIGTVVTGTAVSGRAQHPGSAPDRCADGAGSPGAAAQEGRRGPVAVVQPPSGRSAGQCSPRAAAAAPRSAGRPARNPIRWLTAPKRAGSRLRLPELIRGKRPW